MAFNFSTKYDFMPKLTIGGEQLEVVESTKLLGVMISSDLKWNHHTDYVVKKAKKRLWCIRRLSKLGASTSTLLDQYHLTTRSILELATPVFNGGLSQTNIQSFEEVQKMAFRIILKGNYHSYQNALAVLGQKTLEERREDLSLKFAKKNVGHPKMKHIFEVKKNMKTRSGCTFKETKFKTLRGQNGPANYLVRLLNNAKAKK